MRIFRGEWSYMLAMNRQNEINMLGDKSKQINQFLQLLSDNHHRIHAYILSLVPVRTTADDLMQETTLVMWKKFGDFESGTDFVSWGIAIARFIILDYRKDKNNKVIHLEDQVIQEIATKSERRIQHIDRRIDALKLCVKKLPDKDRFLLKLRYESEIPAKNIAERLGRTFQTVYKSLARIQANLARCIRRTLATEEWA